MKRAIIVQGLGFGDEGKGATVDFLAREFAADLVVRFCGGSQAAHNVVLPDGRRHVFAQFGSGTLAGAATYLGEQMIINPPAMHAEARHLRELTGDDPFAKLLIHPRALVSTVYHQQLNRLRELSRGANRHGSCGHGIGETRHYWLRYGRDAIFAADLKDADALVGKLELLRQRALIEAQEFIERVPADEQGRLEIFMEPVGPFVRELELLADPLELQATLPDFTKAIFEGAQGVLLDEWRGFHPYTTWSTVTLHHALAMIDKIGVEELCILGLTRAYTTRHGAGPLPTFDPELDRRLSDPGNPANAWQGTLRRGWLDLVLLRYAAEAAGAPLDGLVVNHLDDLAELSPRICVGYRLTDGSQIDRLPSSTAPNLRAQEKLTTLLEQATPIYETPSTASLLDRLVSEVAPLAITAAGLTHHDRFLHHLRFRRVPTAPRIATFGGLGPASGCGVKVSDSPVSNLR
jgi:adenylosuccinate synthase